ncbi:MAG: hypothetical protein HZA52_01870 [Planctomycetes bacterium]|nr:hypothetical protein [Planctomycetota bacterium]
MLWRRIDSRRTRRASPVGALWPVMFLAVSSACAGPRAGDREAARTEVVATPAVEPALEPPNQPPNEPAVAPAIEPSVEPANEPAPREPLPFPWPLPPGWIAETIPFPLGFAPSLNYSGLEELRFAPGMFKAESEDFWTYAFVWWLEGEVALDASKLNEELAIYFEGLSAAVEGPDFDAERAKVVSRLAPAPSDDAKRTRWHGTVSSYDAFATHARIELHVEVESFRCEARDRTVAMFLVSPRPPGHTVWTQLAAVGDSFRCSAP